MVFLENLKSQLESFRPKIKELHDVFAAIPPSSAYSICK